MKIFAKRTKKKAESSAPRTVNKSDPIVEELLKTDPSEWNAKEKRMVMRYRKRKTAESNEKVDIASTSETEKIEDAEKEIEEPKEDTEQEESVVDDDDSSSSENADEIIKEDENEEVDGGGNSSSDGAEYSNKMKVDSSTTEKEEKTEIPAADKSAEEDGKVAKDHEIWTVLDKLNSKHKRTLSRKLDRIGKSALEAVEQEANKILDETMPIVVDSKRDQTQAASTDKNSSSNTIEPKKKKQKKGPDWSSLPPLERFRREDQRKKQQEAAERKARGEAIKPGHKVPLNSARRRANRRKPKWGSKTPTGAPNNSSYKQDHHSSGFLHRKDVRAHE